jgi:hypothetical protein
MAILNNQMIVKTQSPSHHRRRSHSTGRNGARGGARNGGNAGGGWSGTPGLRGHEARGTEQSCAKEGASVGDVSIFHICFILYIAWYVYIYVNILYTEIIIFIYIHMYYDVYHYLI